MPVLYSLSKKVEENNSVLQVKKLNCQSDGSCKVMSWNVWSILNDNKLNNFLLVLQDNDIMIACISETWFDSNNGKFTATIKNAAFDIIHAYREKKRGGGSAIIYKKTLQGKPGEASSSKYSSFEYSYMLFDTDTRSKTLIVSLYRKQEINCKVFCHELEGLMSSIFNKADVVILTGDFNVWGEITDNTDNIGLLHLMNSYGLSQLVNEPTHRSGHTLDHLYVNRCQINISAEVVNGTFGITTDHFPVLFNIPCRKKQQTEKVTSFRRTKDIDQKELKSDLKNMHRW